MRDAIHGFINIPPYCQKIIDNPLFQRLGSIRQLTSAEYVFPCAQHTRKSHSIGAMHVASRYIKAIIEHKNSPALGSGEKRWTIRVVEIAALLHDIAHGPYSHSWDSTVYSSIYNVHKGHDQHRHVLLDYFDLDENTKRTVKRIWNNELPYLSALISGPISCDRLDFIKRDSYFTGCQYGCFDIERIINNCWFEWKDNEYILVYDAKIIKSVIQGLNTRLYMYEELYLHKTVISAAILIEAMILEASEHFDYLEKSKDIEQFVYLNDRSVFQEILTSDLEKAKKYADMLYKRQLPKLVSEKKIMENNRNPCIEFIDDNTVKWTSRTLSKDFSENFEKFGICVGRGENIIPFEDYCKDNSEETYYFERIYRL